MRRPSDKAMWPWHLVYAPGHHLPVGEPVGSGYDYVSARGSFKCNGGGLCAVGSDKNLLSVNPISNNDGIT